MSTVKIRYKPAKVRVSDARKRVSGARYTIEGLGKQVSGHVIPPEGPSAEAWLGMDGADYAAEWGMELAHAAREGAAGRSGVIVVKPE